MTYGVHPGQVTQQGLHDIIDLNWMPEDCRLHATNFRLHNSHTHGKQDITCIVILY